MISRISLTGMLLLSLAACSSSWETSSLDAKAKKQTVDAVSVNQINVTSAAFNPATQVNLGQLKVSVNKTTAFHPNPTVDQVEQKLREDAAKLGATEVVSAEISAVQVTPLSWGTRKGTGIAVRPK